MKPISLWALLLLLPAGLVAQTPSPVSPPSNLNAADDAAWQTVKGLGRPTSSSTATSGKTVKPRRGEKAAKFLDEANQLRAFYTTYPAHASAKEARLREALALNHAALNGDTASDARRTQLIETVRQDTALPLAKRYEAVAWSKQVALRRQKPANGAAFIAAQEALTREMIQEFPSVQTGYESLLGIAHASHAEAARAILRDLIGSSDANSVLQGEAQRALDQLNLVGKSLQTVLGNGGSLPAASRSGQTTVIYSWNGSSNPSALSRRLTAGILSPPRYVGICVDEALSDAERVTKGKALPGEQLRFADSAAAREALKIGRDLVVYVVSTNGIIVDVRGGEELGSKLSIHPVQ